jgi:hypothetical protein
VVFLGIVLIGVVFPEIAELEGVDALIIVHGADVEAGETEREGEGGSDQEKDSAGAGYESRPHVIPGFPSLLRRAAVDL